MFAHDSGHLCRGKRIHTSAHCDFGNCPQILLECTRILHQLPVRRNMVNLKQHTLLVRKQFGKQKSSVQLKTAWAPKSSFTMSPRSTTLPLHFCNVGSNSSFLTWHVSINVEKWSFALSLCASKMTSFFLSTFSNCHAVIVSCFFACFILLRSHPEFSSLGASE